MTASNLQSNNSASPTVVIVPGLRDHVPAHWQTHLQAQLPNAVSMAPLELDRLSCSAQVQRLEETLSRITGPVILVAHSAGVITVAHWAQQYRRPIHGALLAAPANLEAPLPEGYPSGAVLLENGWLPIPRAALLFPSIAAVSDNDPLGNKNDVLAMALAWGSRIVEIGAVGHLNPASGFGEWPQAIPLIRSLY